MNTVDTIEVVWTAVNFIGLLVTLFAVTDAVGDLRLVNAQKLNGARRLVARANVRRELLRIFQLLLFTIAGLIALFQPTPSSTVARAFLLGSLIVAAALVSVGAILDRIARFKLLNHE